ALSLHDALPISSRKLPAPIDQLRQKCLSSILFVPAHPHFTDHHLRIIARNHILHILHTLLCTLLPVILIRIERHTDHIPFTAVGLHTIEQPTEQATIIAIMHVHNDLPSRTTRLHRAIPPIVHCRIIRHTFRCLSVLPHRAGSSLVTSLHPSGRQAASL